MGQFNEHIEMILPSTYYRKVFVENKLPNVYTAFFYFKKPNKTAEELFKNGRVYLTTDQHSYNKYLDTSNWLKYGCCICTCNENMWIN